MFAQRRMQRELPGPQTAETGGGRKKERVCKEKKYDINVREMKEKK